MVRTNSEKLYKKAQGYFPGGVNSPVRAFKAVEGSPLFIHKGKGPYIWDEDDNQFIDFCCSFGPHILGHNYPDVKESITDALERGTSFGAPTALENELAELILSKNKFIDKIRFVSSGTEAVMSGIRLARGYTGRDKIIKFDGCYHGHSDSLLVKAGSGLATFGESSSAGVPESSAKDTIVLPLDDSDAVKECFEKYGNEIACVLIEPIPANNGLLIQRKEYLEQLREICTENGSLLFFDEVISGFRIAFSGAAEYFSISPDIVSYGKIIGGGMPVGAYGAKAEIMKSISPDGPVYQAGTLSGNPIAMAAGVAQLAVCSKPEFYSYLEHKTTHFVNEVNAYSTEKGYAFRLINIGSIFWPTFSKEKEIRRSDVLQAEDMEWFKKLHSALLERSVYLGPSGYEVGFVSHVHTEDILHHAAQQFKNVLDEIMI